MGERTVRMVAVTASLMLHGVWFVQAGGESGVRQPVETRETTTVTRLAFVQPQQEIVQQQTVKKPVEVQAEKAKPVKKEVVQSQPQPKPPQQEQLASTPPAAAQAPMLDEGMVEQERQRYLAEVMAHIERHKRYPKTARRRGITGELQIHFLLLPDGTVQGLVVRNGPEVLITAARQSVEQALPMPSPPASVHCPLECRFRMKFSLGEA